MLTHEVLRAAIGGNAKAVRASLRRLGKRVSLRWLYYQCEPPADVNRIDVYGALWRLVEAIWMANPSGAELIFEDFYARVEELRGGGRAPDLDLPEQLAQCESLHSAVIGAFLRREGPDRLCGALIDSILASRRMLTRLTRPDAYQAFEIIQDRAPPPLGRAGARGAARLSSAIAAPAATGGRVGVRAAAREGGTLVAHAQTSPSDACDGREALMKNRT